MHKLFSEIQNLGFLKITNAFSKFNKWFMKNWVYEQPVVPVFAGAT